MRTPPGSMTSRHVLWQTALSAMSSASLCLSAFLTNEPSAFVWPQLIHRPQRFHRALERGLRLLVNLRLLRLHCRGDTLGHRGSSIRHVEMSRLLDTCLPQAIEPVFQVFLPAIRRTAFIVLDCISRLDFDTPAPRRLRPINPPDLPQAGCQVGEASIIVIVVPSTK